MNQDFTTYSTMDIMHSKNFSKYKQLRKYVFSEFNLNLRIYAVRFLHLNYFCRHSTNNCIIWYVLYNDCIRSDHHIITYFYFTNYLATNSKLYIITYFCNLRIIMLAVNYNARINFTIISNGFTIYYYPPLSEVYINHAQQH